MLSIAAGVFLIFDPLAGAIALTLMLGAIFMLQGAFELFFAFDWTLGYVCLLLLQASLIYVTSRLVVPAPTDEEPIDLTAFFDRNRRKFMGVITIYALVNEATNLTLEGFNSTLLGLMVLAWVVLFAIAWLCQSPRIQLVVAAANVALTAWYAVTFVPAL